MDDRSDNRHKQADRSATAPAKRSAQGGPPSKLSWLFPYVGFSLLFVWAAYLLRPLDAHSPHAFVAYHLGQALVCLAVLPLARKRAWLKEASPVLDGATTVVMLLSPWMALGAAELPGPPLFWAIASGALGGAS